MSARLLGLGSACPPRAWSREQALELAAGRSARGPDEQRLLAALYRRSGVRQRFLVADEALYPPGAEPHTGARMEHYVEHAAPLARRAAEAALRDADVEAPAITHLVTVSCTGFDAPGVDFALIRELDLSPSVERTHVGFMGCHGLLNALGVAAAFARDPSARVLVCAVELCSLHMRYGWDPERVVSHALFGDGAAALVVGEAPARDARRWAVAARGSRVLPDSEDAMTWRVGERGFEMTLSAAVPDVIAAHLRPWLGAWLEQHGCGLDAVASWAVHPGGPRLLDAVSSCLDLPPGATAVSRAVLAEHGNMSSPTVAFVLQRLMDAGASTPCVALGFGPGLVAEALLLR